MSLINDALKKAQRERSGEHPPTPPPEKPLGKAAPPAAPVAQSDGTPGFKGWPWILAVAVFVAGFVAWRTIGPPRESEPIAVASGTRPAESPPVVAPAQQLPPTDVAAPAGSPSTGIASVAPAPVPGGQKFEEPVQVAVPARSAPAVTAQPFPVVVSKAEPAATPPPVVAATREPPRIVSEHPAITVNIPPPATERPAPSQMLPATVVTIPESPVGTSPAAPLVSVRQQDPRILGYLDALRVNGIRPSPDDPKVLMNNRVFRINDVVDRELNLRLTVIAPNRLTFEDERGMPYVKNF